MLDLINILTVQPPPGLLTRLHYSYGNLRPHLLSPKAILTSQKEVVVVAARQDRKTTHKIWLEIGLLIW